MIKGAERVVPMLKCDLRGLELSATIRRKV
jgi:hypothetical protein